MAAPTISGDATFEEALVGLRRGDFSRLEPLFVGQPFKIVEWHAASLFGGYPAELAEALTNACFLGRVEAARYLMDRGVDPAAGNGTGMNAFHWAANRGELEVVRLLIERGAPMEALNQYGGTVLGTTVWSAIHEPRVGQVEVIEALLAAGANPHSVEFPTGNESVDRILERYRQG